MDGHGESMRAASERRRETIEDIWRRDRAPRARAVAFSACAILGVVIACFGAVALFARAAVWSGGENVSKETGSSLRGPWSVDGRPTALPAAAPGFGYVVRNADGRAIALVFAESAAGPTNAEIERVEAVVSVPELVSARDALLQAALGAGRLYDCLASWEFAARPRVLRAVLEDGAASRE